MQIKDPVGYSCSASTEEAFHPSVSLHLNKFICVNLRNGWRFHARDTCKNMTQSADCFIKEQVIFFFFVLRVAERRWPVLKT